MSKQQRDGYCLFTCDGCGTNGRTWREDELPSGWTSTGGFWGHEYCPRCTAKIDDNEGSSDFKKKITTQKKTESCCGCIFLIFIIFIIITVI